MRYALALLMLVLVSRIDAAVAVINANLSVTHLTTDRVRDLLLGRINTWDSGESVVIVLCTDTNDADAVEEISGRTVALLQRGWKRLVFSGTGAMPLVATTRQAALDLVAKHPGAIAVLPMSEEAPGCKTITIANPGASR